MGRYTKSDICKNVLYIGQADWYLDHIREVYNFFEDNIDVNEYGTNSRQPTIKGWVKIGSAADCGKNGKLLADEFEKDGKIVFILNSHEYSNVGYYYHVVFSDDREAVEQFLKDFYEEIKADMKEYYDWDVIEDMEAVQQTI